MILRKSLEHTYDKNGSTWPTFFVTKFLSKLLWASKKISIICTLWYEFLNDLDTQSDSDKKFVTKKSVK